MAKIPIAKPYLNGDELQAVTEVLQSGWVSQGPKAAEFERELAALVGVKHARAVNSGTNAIHLALLGCGVEPEDEIIVPAFTCVASLHPLEYIGARPVLVDIDIDTFGLDVTRLTEAITPRTKGIMVVHLFGLAADIEETMDCASRHGLWTIEDAALGLGARIGDRSVGGFGEASCLSFHPRKMITTGEGGMMLTNSDEIAARAARLRNYGASVPAWDRHRSTIHALPTYDEVGYNYKLTDIAGAIGLAQLKKLPAILQMRREIAKLYEEALADLPWLKLPREPAGRTHAYQSYVCLVSPGEDDGPGAAEAMRLGLLKHLAGRGVASVQAAQAMQTIGFYRSKYGWKPGDFPIALRADKASVALPIYPGLSRQDQEYVIESVRSFQP